jgi:hypothetical protein
VEQDGFDDPSLVLVASGRYENFGVPSDGILRAALISAGNHRHQFCYLDVFQAAPISPPDHDGCVRVVLSEQLYEFSDLHQCSILLSTSINSHLYNPRVTWVRYLTPRGWSLWHLKEPGDLCLWQPRAIIKTVESQYRPRFDGVCCNCDRADPSLYDGTVPRGEDADLDFEI